MPSFQCLQTLHFSCDGNCDCHCHALPPAVYDEYPNLDLADLLKLKVPAYVDWQRLFALDVRSKGSSANAGATCNF